MFLHDFPVLQANIVQGLSVSPSVSLGNFKNCLTYLEGGIFGLG